MYITSLYCTWLILKVTIYSYCNLVKLYNLTQKEVDFLVFTLGWISSQTRTRKWQWLR